MHHLQRCTSRKARSSLSFVVLRSSGTRAYIRPGCATGWTSRAASQKRGFERPPASRLAGATKVMPDFNWVWPRKIDGEALDAPYQFYRRTFAKLGNELRHAACDLLRPSTATVRAPSAGSLHPAETKRALRSVAFAR